MLWTQFILTNKGSDTKHKRLFLSLASQAYLRKGPSPHAQRHGASRLESEESAAQTQLAKLRSIYFTIGKAQEQLHPSLL
jgi:hypothetical protein